MDAMATLKKAKDDYWRASLMATHFGSRPATRQERERMAKAERALIAHIER